MNYFLNCKTVFDVKKLFRELAMKYHPDHGGDNETMRIVLEQYHDALRSCHGQTNTGTDGKEHTYKYNWANEVAIAQKIQDILALRLPVDVSLVGTWIWVQGQNVLTYRKELEQAGLKFQSKRGMFYWKPYKGRSRHNSKASFNDLAAKYGHKKYANQQEHAIA